MSDDAPPAMKWGYTVPVSFEMLLDSGAITEEQAREMGWEPFTYPPLPLRRRVRYRLSGWWHMRPRIHLGPCDHGDCS